MRSIRPALALDPTRFGRRPPTAAAPIEIVTRPSAPRLADDLKLFAMTFAGGFLFVAVYLA